MKAEVPRTKKNARRWRHQPKVRKFNHKELKEGKAMGVFNPEILRIHERNDLQRDPFDRLLIAQSIEEQIPLITSDSWVEDYRIETIW